MVTWFGHGAGYMVLAANGMSVEDFWRALKECFF